MARRPKARATIRHPIIGAVDDDEVIDAQFEEKPETYVGRVWDEERMAPIPDPPDEPPVVLNGKTLDEVERAPLSLKDLARATAAKLLRRASELLDPD